MKRLRTRLLLLVLLAVTPALAAIVYYGYREQHAAYSRVRKQATTVASTVRASYRQNSRQTSNLVATLAQVPAVTSGSLKACDSFTRHVLKHNSTLANIGVINTRGYLVCSALPFAGHVYLGDRSYFNEALHRHSDVVGTFQVGRVVHVPMIVFAAPLPAHARTGRRVIYASLSLRGLNRIVDAATLPAGSTLTLLDVSGRVIAHYPGAGHWLGKRIPSLDRLANALGGRESMTRVATGPHDAKQLFSIYAQRNSRGMAAAYVVVAVPRSQILAPGREAMLVSLIILAAVAVLLLAITWWGSNTLILRRVDALVQAAEKLGQGKLTARSRVRGRDELARLGASFDAMADSLEKHSSHLAKQVERGDRLTRTYRVLSAINSVLLRERDRDTLLQEVCLVTTEIGDHPLAWVGLLDEENDRVQLAAQAGTRREIVESLYVSTDTERPEGQGTVGPALESGKPHVCNDVENDPRMLPWRETLLDNECRSAASFPLRINERLFGNFTIYARQAGFFNAQEVKLFSEVAADMAVGLELIEANEQRDYLTNYDPATGLENRNRFLANLEQTLRVLSEKSPRPSILAVEIPELRKIADHYGHHVSDGIKRMLVPRLRSVLREHESLAMLGGDVFGIVAFPDDTRGRRPEAVAQQILELCPMEVEVDGCPHIVTARIGAARAEGESGPASLVRNAEVAVHALGMHGESKFQVYSRQQDIHEARRHQIRQGLRRAIARDELNVVYQPYFDVKEGRLAGAEALLRWNSGTLGPVSPGEFIPVAEESGLINEIGAWVFRRVLQQLHAWHVAGISPGVVSVNMSVTELQQTDVVKSIELALHECGIDPRQSPVALEMTETAVVQDFEHVSEILHQLRALGLRTYLDDYGTGYSSLLYLQRTPLDVLKIDLSFIRRIVEDATSLALTRSSISLAHSLDLEVIAEGVEEREQLDILRELDCDIAQGYLYSHPMPAIEMAAFIGDGKVLH